MRLTLPLAASTGAQTDLLLLGLLAVSLAVLGLVFWLMLVYAIRYRHNSPVDRGALAEKSFRFEISWTVATLVIFFGLFIWGSTIYVRLYQPPANALKVYVVAKQWMWKIEHAGGQREINALHIPVDTPIELIMTSEDVIHDFFVPAFRVKRDVLPGQYETMWFRPDRIGTYHLFCSQFCGTAHSNMIGDVVVMSAQDYAGWLTTSGGGKTLAAQGKGLFIRYGCAGCHLGGGTVRAPSLVGLYGSPVPLSDGSTAIADDRYIRDSIMQPKSQVVASYEPIMPSFANVIGEDDLVRLVAYIHSLAAEKHG
ncbi:cytochrome c oxidase subunit II [Acidisphaera sp. S103]|uniref:cytochrome c oxidase subunit II n=1 Tax=Acidisphaera sp. S103 TaxID=1747223 RepID=UPI00131B81B2|nr:cytochrome c oxidase subunit II [Acidisphaera sp. S103]